MDLLDIPGERKPHRHLLDDGSEDDAGMMESNCVQYRLGNNQGEGGPLSYRVVSSEAEGTTPTTGTGSGPLQAVLASPLNGQFYVIGNPSDVLGGVGQRSIAPRAGPFTLEAGATSNSREERQGRRATHNEVERRRRDNINNWIMKLSKLIPDVSGPGPGESNQGGKHTQSKGGILAKACEYVAELRNTNQRLMDNIKQSDGVTTENERLSAQLEQLQQENAVLKQQLQNHGIMPQTQDIKFAI